MYHHHSRQRIFSELFLRLPCNDAADATLEAKEIALKSLFLISELEKLGKLLDMSTLEPHEVKKLNSVCDTAYEFKRYVHFGPRNKLSNNMLDVVEFYTETYDKRRMIEKLTGKSFDPSLRIQDVKLTIHPSQPCCGDQELMSFTDIALCAAMIILLPVSTFGLFMRLNAYMTGVKLVLSGQMKLNKNN